MRTIGNISRQLMYTGNISCAFMSRITPTASMIMLPAFRPLCAMENKAGAMMKIVHQPARLMSKSKNPSRTPPIMTPAPRNNSPIKIVAKSRFMLYLPITE